MARVYIETYGCAHNIADSERLSGLLLQNRHHLVNTIEEAEVIIINTCTVKGPTESAFFSRLEDISIRCPNKAITIAGCIPQSDPHRVKKYSAIGPFQYHNISSIIESATNHNISHLLETGHPLPLNIPKVRKNHLIEIIPICTGCLSRCTFCKTKLARGSLRSHPPNEIIELAKLAISEGIKEIWLTGEDTMCYGFDIHTTIPQLLNSLISLPGNFKIRIGMGSPIHFAKIQPSLIPLLSHPKIFRFIHLPLQSGSDSILDHMRRLNTVQEWLDQINTLRLHVPDITIATDIIVGYPTESINDFHQTLQVIEQARPDIINISRFWPRPGTPAFALRPPPVEIVKERTRTLTALFHRLALEKNQTWLGRQCDIIITEPGRLPRQWIGRNQSYRPIIVEGDYRLGDKLSVKITSSTTFDLRASVI